METTVVHCRRERFDVYIGRMSAGQVERFGNPFRVGVHGIRGQCIEMFREWIKTGKNFGCIDATEERRQWILENLHTLKGKRLGCFCSPNACHGDVLAELADAQ